VTAVSALWCKARDVQGLTNSVQGMCDSCECTLAQGKQHERAAEANIAFVHMCSYM